MDFIFDAFSAWHSLGLFLMAFVFTAIGGGIVSYEMFWRIKGVRVRARVKEVRVVGKRKDDGSLSSLHDSSTMVQSDEKSSKPLSKDLKENPVSGTFGILFALLFLGIPLVFTGFGLHMGYTYYDLVNNGEYADARVIRNDSSRDSDGHTSYKAVLAFQDYNGRRHEVKDKISYGSKPSYKTGTQIGVYYDENDPKRFVIDDYWHNMAMATIMVCVFPVFFGFLIFASKMQKNPKGGSSKKKRKGAAKYAGETYYTVYEYKMPNGERTEFVSGSGANMLGKNIPGRQIMAFISAANPQKMKKPSIGIMIFGFVFLLPGLFIGVQAVKTFEFNIFTVLIPLAIIAYIGFKISRFISRIPKDELKEGLSEMRNAGLSGIKVSSSNAGKNAEALTSAELRERMKAYVKTYKVGAYACFVIALLSVGCAYYAGMDMVDKLANGVSARGEVIGFESRYSSSSSSSSSSGYTYYSVVQYRDSNGNTIKFEDGVGSSHKMHKRGEGVDVLYNPEDPYDAMIDRGIWNWLISGGLALLGFLMALAGLDNMRTVGLYGGGRQRV